MVSGGIPNSAHGLPCERSATTAETPAGPPENWATLSENRACPPKWRSKKHLETMGAWFLWHAPHSYLISHPFLPVATFLQTRQGKSLEPWSEHWATPQICHCHEQRMAQIKCFFLGRYPTLWFFMAAFSSSPPWNVRVMVTSWRDRYRTKMMAILFHVLRCLK